MPAIPDGKADAAVQIGMRFIGDIKQLPVVQSYYKAIADCRHGDSIICVHCPRKVGFRQRDVADLAAACLRACFRAGACLGLVLGQRPAADLILVEAESAWCIETGGIGADCASDADIHHMGAGAFRADMESGSVVVPVVATGVDLAEIRAA